MAKAAWVNVSPTTGTGNGTLKVSAEAYTGRVARSSTLTVTATGVANPATVAVSQKEKPEFVTMTGASATKTGGSVTLTGTSNSSKLTFSLGEGALAVSLPEKYTAATKETANGTAITGDPGAAAQYSFSIVCSIPPNTTIRSRLRTVTVTAAGGQTANGDIMQDAGDAALSLSPLSVSLEASGAEKTVTVTSNTTWTVA